MPELPEVETVRRQLAPHVAGTLLSGLVVHDPRWCAPLAPLELVDVVLGRRVEELRRRGKYLDLSLADDVHLLMHLRMTGTLLLDTPGEVPHTRVELVFDGTRRLLFVDPRRFGTGQVVVGADALAAFYDGRLGVEPFDPAFTPEHLRSLARGRTGPIKSFLLDQRQIAGVGNIYADEALYRVQVHPLRPAGSLTAAQYAGLRDAIRETLAAGIDANGASIDDFRHLDGARGSFQDRFLVHRREGEPCPRCGTPIRKIVVGGRGTYVCEHCQPRPRRRRGAAAIRPRSARRGDPSGRPPQAP